MEHPFAAFQTDITKVSREVARQFAAPSGPFGHGWEIVSADDIEQAIYEQFIKSGMTTEGLNVMDSSQAYIRKTARLYGANNEARARRRVVPVEIKSDSAAETPGLVGCGGSDFDREEWNVEAWWLLSTAEALVVDILFTIANESRQRVAWLCYFEGLSSSEISTATKSTPGAVRKALQRARDSLGPEMDACLRVWREFRFPFARRLRRLEAAPTALLELLRG